MSFKGDTKFGRSFLYEPEQRLKNLLLPCVPRGVETYHLTLTTLLWSLLIPLFAFLARASIHWLWAASLMIVFQYVTDLLDGAIGRQRNTGLVKWGFYMDHFLDYLFLCSILIAYAILIPQVRRAEMFLVMAMFGAFMVNSFLSFACTQEFRIAYMGIGPTEIRLLFIIINTLLIFLGPEFLVRAIPYVVSISIFGLFVTVYRTQKELWRQDMRQKQGDSHP